MRVDEYAVSECPSCQILNSHKDLICIGCGAELPWAQTLRDERRRAVAAKAAAEVAQRDAQNSATQARQAIPKAAPPAASQAAANAGAFLASFTAGVRKVSANIAFRRNHICTRCGHVGPPQRTNYVAHAGCMLLLLCLGIVPGLIYLVILCLVPSTLCRKCKKDATVPLNSPGGAEAYRRFYP